MRLDKFLANASVGTRSEVKKIIRSGRITINGDVVKRPENAVTADDQIALDDRIISYQEYEYYMLNKPVLLKETRQTELLITITEGRYHQIKRMFQSIQKPVLYLKRIKMGTLELDRTLGLGEYRSLSVQELESLGKHI